MKDPGGVIRRWLERLSLFSFEVYHRSGKDLVDADFLSRLNSLPGATPSEAEDATPWDPTHKLPFPLDRMLEAFPKAKTTAGSCAIIQPTAEGQPNQSARTIDLQCTTGNRCNACMLGVMRTGGEVHTITPPAGTLYELQDTPPVVCPKTGTYHIYEMAEAQAKDPLITWFVEQVVEPVRRGKHANLRIQEDMHEEAKQMLRTRHLLSIGEGPQFGDHKLLVYKGQRVVVPPAYRQDLIQAAHTVAHMGMNATQKSLESYFYWPGLHKDVEVALSSCVGCLHKYTSNLKKGEHYSKTLPPGKLHTVYVDLVGPVAVESKRKYLLTIMDAFTRYADQEQEGEGGGRSTHYIPDRRLRRSTYEQEHHRRQGNGIR